jgi:hypothetical protein
MILQGMAVYYSTPGQPRGAQVDERAFAWSEEGADWIDAGSVGFRGAGTDASAEDRAIARRGDVTRKILQSRIAAVALLESNTD